MEQEGKCWVISSTQLRTTLRRFVCGQYESTPPKITYDQDFWAKANDYQSLSQANVIALWQLINTQIATILTTMPPANYGSHCDTGKLVPQLRTLEWLAEDYIRHMKHHLNQIISDSFNIQYP